LQQKKHVLIRFVIIWTDQPFNYEFRPRLRLVDTGSPILCTDSVLSFLQGLEWLAEKHFHIESSDHLVVWNCGEAGPKKSAIEEKRGGEWQSTIGPQKIPDHGSTRWGGDDSEQDENVCYFSLAKNLN